MALTRLTPRAAAPITLDQVKAHCRIDGSVEDALLAIYIQAAVDHVEANRGVMGRALLNQAWELTYDAFPDGAIHIPLGPLVSVTSVEYVDDATGTETLWVRRTMWWTRLHGRAVSSPSMRGPSHVKQ